MAVFAFQQNLIVGRFLRGKEIYFRFSRKQLFIVRQLKVIPYSKKEKEKKKKRNCQIRKNNILLRANLIMFEGRGISFNKFVKTFVNERKLHAMRLDE